MSDHDLDYASIQHNVDRKLQRQKWLYRILFLVTHILFFAVTMLVVWGTVATNPQVSAIVTDTETGAAVIVLVPTIMWAAVLLFHVASLFFESGAGEKTMRERLLVREVGKDILRNRYADDRALEKPKRHSTNRESLAMLSSDDGELIFADEDDRTDQPDYVPHVNQTGSS